MPKEPLKLVKDDPWLEPSAQDIQDRHNRYLHKLKSIEDDFGSLDAFADGYKYFGIHFDAKRNGWIYREWAPHAKALYLVGDFNNWEQFTHPLRRNDFGVWEIFLDYESNKDTFTHGSKIKVLVDSDMGLNYRIPAYITRVVQDEDTKNFTAQLWFPETFDWEDDKPILKKDDELFIYECHVGMAQEKEGVGTYKEFEENVLPRVKDGGYNVVQMMAIQEHPYYGSFGYHVSNFFAPSSRFGTPEDLKSLIKTAHSMGIAHGKEYGRRDQPV
jgi:1,4-alpha-glucan branching enzyme